MHFSSSAAAAALGIASLTIGVFASTLRSRAPVPTRLTHEESILRREIYSDTEINEAVIVDRLILESAGRGISAEVALENFEFQFGTTLEEQLENIIADFDGLRITDIYDKKYLTGFVDCFFIRTRTRIQKLIDSDEIPRHFLCQSVYQKCLPRNVGELTGITNLVLFANRLTCLPATLSLLSSLERMDVRLNPHIIINPDYIPENCTVMKSKQL